FTTTDSQGLFLMHEALFAASGMRLPMVIVNANRAVSAPLNIWNDQQDSISERDSGWIQIYCNNNQEAVDAVPQAFKISEDTLLPVMVCVDGFYLTHIVEQIDVPEKELILKYLPGKRDAKFKLDTSNPISMGMYAMPRDYQGFRHDLHLDLVKAKENVKKEMEAWAAVSGRRYGNGLWEEIHAEGADILFVGMGSVMENAELAVEKMRAKGKKVGIVRIRCYRPFPCEVAKAFGKAKKVVVFEKALGFGASPPLYTDISHAVREAKLKTKVYSIAGGLGGKDVTVEHIIEMLAKVKKEKEPFQMVWGGEGE
ncbi:MAG: transketolase C-terminal domain-containing protein, partial [Candidatus Bilamarchaeaceae archaeon]